MTDVRADPIELLRTRTSAKWVLYPPDVLPLFVAEMDYPLAPPIAETLAALVARSDTGYAVGPGELSAAFVDFAASAWGWAVDPTRIRTTTDVSVAVVETLRAAINPGDRVIITPPVYPPFYAMIPEAGGVVTQVPLLRGDESDSDRATGGWRLDLDGIERAFAEGARAFLLCNPHNPLGLVHSAAELSAVADIAARHGGIVVSDEIHGPLTHPDATFTPFLSVSDAAREHGMCVTSASKAWNLAGLKCAIMIAGTGRGAEAFDDMPIEVGWRTSIFGLQASTAAFVHSRDWLGGAISSIVANRHLLSTLLAEQLPEVRYREPRASFLAWLDMRELGWGDDPSERILRDARVALNPGPSFGLQGNGFARLNLACSPDILTEAIGRIAALR